MKLLGLTAEPAIAEHARERMRLGDLVGAKTTAEAEIQRLGQEGNTPELWRLRFRGAYTGFLGRNEAAHNLFAEAESLAREAGLRKLEADVYLTRAFIFFRQKDYVSSDRLFRAALQIAEQIGGWYLRGQSFWGIGKNLMIQEHYQEAIPWLNESLVIFEEANAPLSIAMVWSELAVCHLGLGDDTKAMELLRKAERVNYDSGVLHNYQVVLANIGNIYLHSGDYLTSIEYYRRALALAREIKDPVSIKKWTRNVNLAYARIRQSVNQANRVCR